MKWFGGFVVYSKSPWRHMASYRISGAVPVVGALWSLECVRSTG